MANTYEHEDFDVVVAAVKKTKHGGFGRELAQVIEAVHVPGGFGQEPNWREDPEGHDRWLRLRITVEQAARQSGEARLRALLPGLKLTTSLRWIRVPKREVTL